MQNPKEVFLSFFWESKSKNLDPFLIFKENIVRRRLYSHMVKNQALGSVTQYSFLRLQKVMDYIIYLCNPVC